MDIKRQAQLVESRIDYHFANGKGGFNIPEGMPFMKEFLAEVNKLCSLLDGNTEDVSASPAVKSDVLHAVRKWNADHPSDAISREDVAEALGKRIDSECLCPTCKKKDSEISPCSDSFHWLASQAQPCVSESDSEFQLKRVYDWLMDENRQPAQTLFDRDWETMK